MAAPPAPVELLEQVFDQCGERLEAHRQLVAVDLAVVVVLGHVRLLLVGLATLWGSRR